MAEPRGFLERWSKRKRAAAASAEAGADGVAAAAEVAGSSPAECSPAGSGPVGAGPADPGPADRPPADAGPAAPVIQPGALPPLESIGAGGDVRAFLQEGVPAALRRAALRRLWTTDPHISGFREVADYDWDFNAPGYGALLPGDDPPALARRLSGSTRRLLDAPPSPIADSTLAVAEPAPADEATSPTTTPAPTTDSTLPRGEPSPIAASTVVGPARQAPGAAPGQAIAAPTAESAWSEAAGEGAAAPPRAGDGRGTAAVVAPPPGGTVEREGAGVAARRRRRHGGAMPT